MVVFLIPIAAAGYVYWKKQKEQQQQQQQQDNSQQGDDKNNEETVAFLEEEYSDTSTTEPSWLSNTHDTPASPLPRSNGDVEEADLQENETIPLKTSCEVSNDQPDWLSTSNDHPLFRKSLLGKLEAYNNHPSPSRSSLSSSSTSSVLSEPLELSSCSSSSLSPEQHQPQEQPVDLDVGNCQVESSLLNSAQSNVGSFVATAAMQLSALVETDPSVIVVS